MMLLSLHNLAKEYGLTPSAALAQASTFDLYVLDLYTRYLAHQQASESGTKPDTAVNLSQQQMKEMIARVKKQQEERAKNVS
jgi:hypothetical protein